MKAKDIILYGVWAAFVAVVSFTASSFSKNIDQNQRSIGACQSDLATFKFDVAANYARKEDLLRFESKIDKLHDLFRQLIMAERNK